MKLMVAYNQQQSKPRGRGQTNPETIAAFQKKLTAKMTPLLANRKSRAFIFRTSLYSLFPSVTNLICKIFILQTGKT
jgi:hypothetical protein